MTIQTPLFPQDHCNDSDAVVDRRTGSYNQFKFSTIQAQNGEIVSTLVLDMHTALFTYLI